MKPTRRPMTADEGLRPAVHPIYIRLLFAAMLQRGFTAEQVLKGTGLLWDRLHASPKAHESPAFLNFSQLHSLTQRCVELSDAPWLGFEVGWSTELSAHGAVGYAGTSCQQLIQVLELVQRYSGLRQALVDFSIEPAGDKVRLVCTPRIDTQLSQTYIVGHISGALLRLMQTITGRNLQTEITFHCPFAAPTWSQHCLALWPATTFGSTTWCFEMPASLLQSPGLSPDPAAYQLAVRECEHQLSQQFKGALSANILSMLRACDGQYPSLAQLAGQKSMSPRTLIRRLKNEGTQYQELLDTVRCELASWLLTRNRSDGQMTIEAIAAKLGYADTSNFSRTFKRWTGLTPSQFISANL